MIKKFRYLRYVFQKNGRSEAQDRIKKGGYSIESSVGIEKRRFRRDWGKRIWLRRIGVGCRVWS